MKAIIIAFTLKGQEWGKIRKALADLRMEVGDRSILIHGFMPRWLLQQKGIPLDVVSHLESLFPVQLNMYNMMPLREEMAELGKKLDAEVYVIGEVKEGVQQEVELYQQSGLNITYISLTQ